MGCELGALVGTLWAPHLHEQSVCSLLAVEGAEPCVDSSSVVTQSEDLSGRIGDATDMDLKKSM